MNRYYIAGPASANGSRTTYVTEASTLEIALMQLFSKKCDEINGTTVIRTDFMVKYVEKIEDEDPEEGPTEKFR